MAVYLYDVDLLSSFFGIIKQRFPKVNVTCIYSSNPSHLQSEDESVATTGDAAKKDDANLQTVDGLKIGSLSLSNPVEPHSYLLRPLSSGDFTKGVMNVLSQLTAVGEVSESLFLDTFEAMRQSKSHYVTVIEDVGSQRIVGHGTLYVHEQFTGNDFADTALVGRVEDIVILEECRGYQLGAIMMNTLNELGKRLQCKKLSLECKDSNCAFYAKLGYQISYASGLEGELKENGCGSQCEASSKAQIDESRRNMFLVRRFDQ